MKYSRKTLSNGLNIFMVHVPDAQSVVFTILVKVGSCYESSEVNGVAHFLEHVFFKGSQNNSEPSDISAIVDSIGGEINASTSKEFTEFYIKAAKNHFGLIYETLTDMILNPLFKEEELKKEKGVIIEEINLYQDNPAAQVDSNLDKIMWPNTSLGREILGTKATIGAMNRKKVFSFKKAYYRPNNIIIGISGSFDEKHAMQKIKKDWSKLARAKIIEVPKLKQKNKGPNINVQNKKTQQAHLALGFKSFAHNDKKNTAVFLLSAVLGGSLSSRLWINIREQKGWAYYIRASNSPYQQTGNFTISTGVKVEKADAALKEILVEIRKIKSDLVTEKELRRTKDYIKGRIALGLEDNNEKLDWLIGRFATTGKIKTVEQFFSEIEKVGAEQIRKVANQIFQNKFMSLAVIGPIREADFKKELNIKENF